MVHYTTALDLCTSAKHAQVVTDTGVVHTCEHVRCVGGGGDVDKHGMRTAAGECCYTGSHRLYNCQE